MSAPSGRGTSRSSPCCLTTEPGHGPGSLPRVVAASGLIMGMSDYGPQDRHAVPNAPGGAGQIDDQRRPGESGQPAGQHRRRYPRAHTRRADRLGDAGYFPVDDEPGHLRGDVAGRQAGPSGGDDDVVAGRHRVAERDFDGRPVGYHDRAVRFAARVAKQRGEHRAGGVGIDPGRGPVGDGNRQRADHGRVQLPVLPPVFSSTMTSVITAAGSIALIMSISASAPTVTAVSASISTPVRSAVRVVTSISTLSSATDKSTFTECRPIGWLSGIRSGVRFAPWMAAILATASASPLGTVPSRRAAIAAAQSSTRPLALAVRAVTSLAETSTILACPARSRCVSSGWTAAGWAECGPGWAECGPGWAECGPGWA